MGWGEAHDNQRGAGTTGQIEEAHKALDRWGVRPGPLAVRMVEVVILLETFEEVLKKVDGL